MVALLCPGYIPFVTGGRFLALVQIISVLPRKGSFMLGRQHSLKVYVVFVYLKRPFFKTPKFLWGQSLPQAQS